MRINLKSDQISIIMPVWKVKAEFLSLSIQSILEQDYDNLELLIMYESSTKKIDDEIMIVLDGFSHDTRVKVIKPKQKGLANALNLGLSEAKGTFVARMDSDDISEKSRLRIQVDFLKKSKEVLVGSWATSISNDGKTIGTIEPPIKHEEIRKKIMFHNPFLHPSICFKKEIIKEIGGYNPNFNGAEDYDLYLRLLSQGYRTSNIPKYLVKLRETDDSVMRGNKWKKLRKINFRVKKNAVKNLGYNNMRDIFYFSLTPLTYLVSPKQSLFVKTKIGYNKSRKIK